MPPSYKKLGGININVLAESVNLTLSKLNNMYYTKTT